MIMLPPIPIPFSASKTKNQDRYGQCRTDVLQCLICSKPVDEVTARWVVLTSDLGKIADPSVDQEVSGGCSPIGPECFRKNKQIHIYGIKS
jgi:hypothetical protein